MPHRKKFKLKRLAKDIDDPTFFELVEEFVAKRKEAATTIPKQLRDIFEIKRRTARTKLQMEKEKGG